MMTIKEYVNDCKIQFRQSILEYGITKKLAIVQVGHVPASDKYVKNKIKDCDECGIVTDLISLPETCTQAELLDAMVKLNKDETVGGYIVQLPLPEGIDVGIVKENIAPWKDVDGFSPYTFMAPATPSGIKLFLDEALSFQYEGKNAVVIGRSDIVGRPMTQLLLDENMNVTVLHSKTKTEDLQRYVANADLIIVAAGKPGLLKKSYSYKTAAIIMDVGINVDENGKLVGDCEPDLGTQFQSPVPGGVGLLTRLALLNNFLVLQLLDKMDTTEPTEETAS